MLVVIKESGPSKRDTLPKKSKRYQKTLPKPGKCYQKGRGRYQKETVNSKNETVNAKNETVKLKEIEKVIYEAMLESKKDNGIIERIGSDKNGHWTIKE